MIAELKPKWTAVAALIGTILIVVPAAFVALYAPVCRLLPDRLGVRTDLPRDFLLAMMAVTLLAPPPILWAYLKERRLRWNITAAGVEVLRDDVTCRAVPWSAVARMAVTFGGIALWFKDSAEPMRLRFVDRGQAAAALQAWQEHQADERP